MLRVFSQELSDPHKFVVTLELVPGRESFGRSTDTLVGMAREAFADGRISAVSITDNPGGNPSLSPDVLGYEIFKYGMDVIVHFTCRDTNRVGMESRALQLARMGMKNLLCLTGDYSGKGFEGRGTPVFDLDSVLLSRMIKGLSDRLAASGDTEPFLQGCGVSPFKALRSECVTQYKKLDKKIEAGAGFVITQLGYDINKFNELIRYHKEKNPQIPVLASVYLLSPGAARAMNKGKVPGALVSDNLLATILEEWKDPKEGMKAAIERAARLGVVLKGLGYRGIHIGGIHKSFEAVGAILDRMGEIEGQWHQYMSDFSERAENTYYWYDHVAPAPTSEGEETGLGARLSNRCSYSLLSFAHGLFFDKSNFLAPSCRKLSEWLDKNGKTWILKRCLEDPMKMSMLSCQSCGDCGIQHAAFLCPESKCPKHTRNGPCGGGKNGFCEVYPEKQLCIWVRAYDRLKQAGRLTTLLEDEVPPRNWELNKTSSWVNFHLNRDHQKS
ncbi:MAG: methylenetetrahydrofolate reductase C-terminal domain-containing protein [Desulfopila sp.]